MRADMNDASIIVTVDSVAADKAWANLKGFQLVNPAST
jgi:hypothetical protein